MSNYQKILIISLLCVAVIFVSGVLLPKYLSRQILEIREELNSQNDISKYSVQANLVPVAEKLGQNEKVFVPSQTVEVTEKFPNVLSNSIQIPSKIKKRRKRQTMLRKRQFVWNFNLNLTEKRNNALPLASEGDSETSDKDEHLDVAIYNKGEGSVQNAFNDIQLTLRLAESYFKGLFKHIENGTDKQGTKRELVDLENNLLFNADGSGDETLIKGREGKFFNLGSFNIFGFRQPPKEKDSLSVSTLPENNSIFVDSVKTTQSPQSGIFTENSHQMPNLSNLQDQSIVASSELNSASNISTSNLPGKTEDGECIDCDSVGFDLSTNSEFLTNYPLKTVTSSAEITDEILEVFCTRLADKMILEPLPDTEDKNIASKDSLNISSSPKHLVLDLLPEKESSVDFASENFLNGGASESEIRQKKFLNFGNLFGLGSGRAADEQDEQSVLTLSLSDIDLKKLPTLVDCEKFFNRKKQMSSKQTTVVDESYTETQLSDISNTKSKITGQEVPTEPNDLNLNTEISFKSTYNEVQPITETLKEGRFFGGLIFGSGDLRSFHSEDFNSRNEVLGSGDMRKLEIVDFNSDKNEFGSGNSRSLWAALFGNRNEFGSGDSRSLEDATPEIQKNAFESGDSLKDSPDLHENISTTNKSKLSALQGLGSGDERDLIKNINVSHIGHKCDNNCSFELTAEQQNNCDDYGCDYGDFNASEIFEDNSKNEWDCHENCSNVSIINSRNETEENSVVLEPIKTDKNLTAENFQRSFTSEVTFNIDSVANKSVRNKIETVDGSGPECLDCNHGNLSKVNKTDIENVFNECDECNFTILGSFNESEENFPTELVIDTDKIVNINTNRNTTSSGDHADKGTFNLETQFFKNPNESTESTQRFLRPVSLAGSGEGRLLVDSKESIDLEEPTSVDFGEEYSNTDLKSQTVHEQTTERNDQRFLRPIFLTGSGDGGLFEDGGGVINLLEEEDTTSRHQNIPSRQARLDQLNLSVAEEKSLNLSNQNNFNSNASEQNSTIPVMPFRRRGRMDDTIEPTGFENNLNSHNFTNKDGNLDTKVKTRSDIDEQITNENKIALTVSSDVIHTNGSVLDDLDYLNKASRFQPIHCTAARECNATLNERCITINSSKICGCSRGYIRNKETKKCIVKKIVETSIKLPGESFEDDLKNPFSPNFQQKKKSSVEMMLWLLQHNPELLQMLSEINEVKFSPGSLIVTLNLVFAAENKSETQLVKSVEDDLQTALRDEKLVKSVPLNIRDASLVSVNGEIDYCKLSELNYCSEHAYCVPNTANPGSFTCHCKEHYRDVSFDPDHSGETCLAKCPQDYCGANGHCEPLANDEKICLCTGLYFGRRCEVPGLYVLIILGLVGFISMTMLLLVIFKKRCSRYSYEESEARGSEENRVRTRINGRVSDAIVLEKNIEATKMVAISTPRPDVAITITRPTMTDSAGSSYEFDSTFDSTPGVERTEENSV